MLSRLMPSICTAPRVWSAWLIGGLCTILTSTSDCEEVRLAEYSGFAEATAFLEAQAPDFTILWPPHAAGALALLPPTLRAADAVPSEPGDQRRYLRLAVIGPVGFDDPPELAGAAAEPRRRFSDVEVRLFAFPSVDRVLLDLRRSLGEARVYLSGLEHETTCDRQRRDQGWDCPGRPPWNHVAPVTLRVEGRDWPAIWAHPVSNHDLVLDLGQRRLGDRVILEAALSDDAATTRHGAVVTVRLEIEGDNEGPLVSETLRRTNGAGVAALTVPTIGLASGHVRLIIRTARDARRHLGINLRIVEEGRASSHSRSRIAP